MEDLIPNMIANESTWRNMFDYVTTVMERKEREDRASEESQRARGEDRNKVEEVRESEDDLSSVSA